MGDKEDAESRQILLFTELDEYRAGKDELNIAEYPLSLAGKTLSPRKGDRAAIITFTDHIRDRKSGRVVERAITVTASPEYGLPTYYDEEVLFGILQITHKRKRQNSGGGWPKEVSFTRYELSKLLGLQHGGDAYKRLSRSIKRLGTTTYQFSYAWFDNKNEQWKAGVGMNFLQKFEWEEPPMGREGRFTIVWNDEIHRSFEAGYLRDIDFLEYRAMRLPLAKALYRFLGKHFWRSRELTFDLRTLAHEKLGLSRDYDIGQVKRALAPALRRLEERGYIMPLPRDRRYTKVRAGEWKVHFQLRGSEPVIATLERALPTELEQRLAEQGVSQGTAAELVADNPHELVERKLDVLAWMDQQKQSPKTNRGAWLAKSIREKWAEPQGYVPKAERERREAEREAARRQAAEKAKERKRIESAYDDACAKRERTVWARFQKLDQADKDRITEEATAGEGASFKRKHAKIFILQHFAATLEAEGSIPPLPPDPNRPIQPNNSERS